MIIAIAMTIIKLARSIGISSNLTHSSHSALNFL